MCSSSVCTVCCVNSLATREAKWTFASFPRERYTKNPPPPRLEQAVGACHQRAGLAHPNTHPVANSHFEISNKHCRL